MELAMSQPRLTICIPTHHGRAVFLREAIESVLSQLGEVPPGSVTLCVSDNASEDGTQALIGDLCRRHPGLISYHRFASNQGFIPNMLQVMREADGEYGWLLSSDDRIAPGGLRRVWDALGSEPDLAGITVNFQSFDVTLTRRLDPLPPRLYPADRESRHLYTSVESFFRQCGSIAGYVSGQIYHRDLWKQAVENLGPARLEAASYFPYLLLLGEMLKRQPHWLWLPEPAAVENRLGNDSVTAAMNRNILRYQCNVLHDITAVWAACLGTRSAAYRGLVEDNAATTWSWRAVCSYKVASHCPPADEVRALVEFTRRLFFLPRYWLTVFPVLLIPHPVLRAVLRPAGHFLRLTGAARRGPSAGIL